MKNVCIGFSKFSARQCERSVARAIISFACYWFNVLKNACLSLKLCSIMRFFKKNSEFCSRFVEAQCLIITVPSLSRAS